MSVRTGPLMAKTVEGIQADIHEAVEHLEAGLTQMRELESVVRGVNGLSSTLRTKGNEIEQVLDTLRSESDAVAKKMLGTAKEPITERVDTAHLEKVSAARSAR